MILFDNVDVLDATGMTQSRLHRALQRIDLRAEKPGRKGRGGAPGFSLANLGAAILYADTTALGFAPEHIAPLVREFEALPQWSTTDPLPSSFTAYLLFDGETIAKSESSRPLADDQRFRWGRAIFAADVRLYVALVGLFSRVRQEPEGERFNCLLRVAEQEIDFTRAALGLIKDAKREKGATALLAFLGVKTDRAAIRETRRALKAGEAEEQLGILFDQFALRENQRLLIEEMEERQERESAIRAAGTVYDRPGEEDYSE